MTKQAVKETLEKQLRLLSECPCADYPDDLVKVSSAMVEIAMVLQKIIDLESGNLRPETKYCTCEKCGKEWHYETAKFCGMCGEKLEKLPEKQ